MVKIILASESSLKENAVKQWFKEKKVSISIKKINIEDNLLPPQPFNTGGALNCSDRIKYVINKIEDIQKYDFIISIENNIKTQDTFLIDMVHIKVYDVLLHKEHYVEGGELEITYKLINEYNKIPLIIEELLESYKSTNKKYIFDGCESTFGELVHKYYPKIQSNNWMKNLIGIDRKSQILSVLSKLDGNVF